MATIIDIEMDIAASLWCIPASLEELNERDFVNHIDQRILFSLLASMKKKGWIYERYETYYCYNKTVVTILNPNGYEL